MNTMMLGDMVKETLTMATENNIFRKVLLEGSPLKHPDDLLWWCWEWSLQVVMTPYSITFLHHFDLFEFIN